MERSSQWQAQTDSYLGSFNVSICGNDYTASAVQVVRNLFASPTASNPDPRPVFVAINCLTNSLSRRHREVLVNEFATEREAVRRIETAQRYDNLKLVGHSDNIDVNAYRY